MKKLNTLCLFILFVFALRAQNNVGIGTPTPDASAILELKSITSGILIPRMSAVQRTAITAPQNGLLVYDTDSSCFYYYNSTVTQWSSLCSTGGASVPVTNIPWYIVGNANTSASSSAIGSPANNNFIGPTDNNAFVIATDNFERVHVTGSATTGTYNASTDGLVGIGTNNPTQKLHIASTNTAIALQDVTARTWNLISEGLGRFRVADATSSATRFELNPSGTGTSAIVDNTSTLLSSGAPTATLQIDAGAGNTSNIKLTNSTTGATATDGLDIGTLTSSAAFIRQYENAPLVFYTNNLERQRLLANGVTSFNLSAPASGAVVVAYGKSYPGVIDNTISDTAIAGFARGDNGVGVYGEDLNGTGIGVMGNSNFASSPGVYGQSSVDLTAGLGNVGVGVWGACTGNASPTGVNYSIGVLGISTVTPSNGIVGVGNNTPPIFLGSGTGGTFVSDITGLLSVARSASSGIGALIIGNALTSIAMPTIGAGVVGAGLNYGVMGFAAATTDSASAVNNSYAGLGSGAASGGYFEVDDPTLTSVLSWAYVAAQNVSGTAQKVIGNGTVNTIVKDQSGHLVALSCPEAPENLFQDLGKGQLQNGHVHITLDPIFAKNIAVNAEHDLRVFVQLKGDCKGVYVSNETQYGFDVTELGNGQSNAPFTWMVMANRADEVLANGTLAKYSAERFPAAPGPQKKTTVKLSGPTSLKLPAKQASSNK